MNFQKHYIFNILTLIVTIVVVFSVGELFFRFYLPLPTSSGRLLRMEWNRDYKKSAFIPDAEAIRKDVLIKINSFGLRNNEIDLHKSSDTLRIALFGDSFAFGSKLQMNEILSSQLQRKLNTEKYDYKKIQVLNFGVYAMNTFQEVMYCLNYGLKFKPDIVMIVWVINDMDMNNYTLQDLEYFVENHTVPKENNQGFSGLASEEETVSNERSKSILKSFWDSYEKLKEKSRLIAYLGPRIKNLLIMKFGLNLEKPDEEKYSVNSEGFKLSLNSLKYINDELSKMGIEFHTIIYPVLKSVDTTYYNDLITKKVENYCISNNINCLNLFYSFFGEESSKLIVSKIDYHPSRYANEIASRAIVKYLKQKSKILGMK